MSKLKNVWVIAESDTATAELSSGAAKFGETTALIRCTVAENESYLNCIPSIVKLAKEKQPQLVLVEATKNGRLAAAAIATAFGTSVLTDVSDLKIEGSAVVGKRMVYGGAAFKTEKASGTAVACIGAGLFEADGATAGEIVDVKADATGVHFIERQKKERQTVNLGSAKIVVGVGRGLGQEENLKMAREFAAAVGGELGCSRPVAEEDKWLPKEMYIGISGVMLKSNLYIACGISGQVQHMVGVNSCKTIIAVNKDKNAPIFKQCDYGLVGDLATVLPALTEKFRK